ncbi:hypothetical protein BCR35DRAFT_319050 [Leucosporidium creatinivorum]|uniref:PQ loop repeat-domain-containing protein n=1 Tax=Leucosporidium creatinivorum TaxID=106004 RepID=A0A1Y2EIM8_9BASI|nr:hypothetical protein BCR35DRAFT_319050 [Leucosporidium creatinivorum]
MVAPNKTLETAFGTIGAVAWSLQIVPQIIKTWRRRDAAGLSTSLWIVWYLSGIFLGAYNIVQNLSIALQVQPQCFCLFSAIAAAQGIHYNHDRSVMASWLICILSLLIGGGVETGFVFAAKADASGKFTTALGVISAVLIVIGLLPQFWEVWKFKAVIGVSYIFLLVDMSGGVFSILSLVWTEGEFDAVASASYAAVIVLEAAIFALVPILNPSYYRRQARKHDEGTQSTQLEAAGASSAEEEGMAEKLRQAHKVAEESPREAASVDRRRVDIEEV